MYHGTLSLKFVESVTSGAEFYNAPVPEIPKYKPQATFWGKDHFEIKTLATADTHGLLIGLQKLRCIAKYIHFKAINTFTCPWAYFWVLSPNIGPWASNIVGLFLGIPGRAAWLLTNNTV